VILVVFTRRSATATASLRTDWPAAVDRFARAVHRYSDRIEMIPDRTLRAELRELGTVLNDSLAEIRGARSRRTARAAGDGAGVRAVLRAGTLCAQATEAAVAAADASRGRDPVELDRQREAVRLLVGAVRDLTGDQEQ
jgi:hypothetical protein